ncbi:MAG: MBL fold metallo-hydrolase [Anderseniella sp.]|jgi:glyoxylase-like metal-dependent hydrolase (beta-lactamase superfamily II)|nr:MBL fold metallo-hydrolase [Anderseniella sp.]
MSQFSLPLSRRQLIAGAAVTAAAVPLAGTVSSVTPAAAKAEMKGVERPTHRRFKLGDFTLTTINDGAISVEDPQSIFGTNASKEDFEAQAQASFLPVDKLQISFTPVIVNTGSELVLFDTGNGDARMPNAGHLIHHTLKAAGYAPEQVDKVIITHYHPDHIGGLMMAGNATFPNATYVAAANEHDFWSAPERMSGGTERVAKLVESNITPMKDKFTFIKDGDEVAPGIRAMATNGHTPGHTAYHIESAGQRILVGGDFANQPYLSIAKPEWHVRFDMDKDGAVATRKKVLDMLAADRIPFTSYHMPFPAVGYIDKRADGSYHYVPVSFQLDA